MVSESSTTQLHSFEEPLREEQIEQMPMYEWDIAEIGHEAPPFTYTVTAESIADYCTAVRNDNPLYLDPEAAKSGPFGEIIAPPTYVIKCAPLRRNEVMHAYGYASPEEKRERATPFAKTDIKFFRPIKIGDEITSTVRLEDKYERRENQFITWRVTATNQDGHQVVDYLYTIIWQRASQNAGQSKSGNSQPANSPEDVAGDFLPGITKVETQDAIDQYAELTRVRPRLEQTSLHSDPEFAQRTIFGSTVNMGVATTAYCSEVIERRYGPQVLLRPGAHLEYKGIRPVYADYEITISGRVVEQPSGTGECELRVHNQEGVLCGVGTATLVLSQ